MPARAYQTSIEIEAPPAVVYRYFTEPAAVLRWMGQWATTNAVSGGEFSVNVNGIPIRGHYVDLDPPHRLVIAWGHAGSDVLPPASSTVEITLEAVNGGTLLQLEHRDLPDEDSGMHGRGWNHYLPRMAHAAEGGSPGTDPWSLDPPEVPIAVRRWTEVAS